MKKIIITIIVILLTTNALSETNTLQTMLINGQLGVDTPDWLKDMMFAKGALEDGLFSYPTFMLLLSKTGQQKMQSWATVMYSLTKKDESNEKTTGSITKVPEKPFLDRSYRSGDCVAELKVKYSNTLLEPTSSLISSFSPLGVSPKGILDIQDIEEVVELKDCPPLKGKIKNTLIEIKENQDHYIIELKSKGKETEISTIVNKKEYNYNNLKQNSKLVLKIDKEKKEISIIEAQITSLEKTSYQFPDILDPVNLPKDCFLAYVNGQIRIDETRCNKFFVQYKNKEIEVIPKGLTTINEDTVKGKYTIKINNKEIHVDGTATVTSETSLLIHKNTEAIIGNLKINTNQEELCYQDENCKNHILETPSGIKIVTNGKITIKEEIKDILTSGTNTNNFCIKHSPVNCPVQTTSSDQLKIYYNKEDNTYYFDLDDCDSTIKFLKASKNTLKWEEINKIKIECKSIVKKYIKEGYYESKVGLLFPLKNEGVNALRTLFKKYNIAYNDKLPLPKPANSEVMETGILTPQKCCISKGNPLPKEISPYFECDENRRYCNAIAKTRFSGGGYYYPNGDLNKGRTNVKEEIKVWCCEYFN